MHFIDEETKKKVQAELAELKAEGLRVSGLPKNDENKAKMQAIIDRTLEITKMLATTVLPETCSAEKILRVLETLDSCKGEKGQATLRKLAELKSNLR